MSRPLDGLRVLDFTHVLAGPFATRIMGDMGADVVKVNSATRPGNQPGLPYYLMWNRNKRALALDMRQEDARATCRRLCERADLVIDNFSAGVLDRWGVGYEAVHAANPRVIYLQMSGMGIGGPWSDFVTYAPTVHALAGLTEMTGFPDREPMGIGVSYNDHVAGLHAAVVALSAIEARRRTGRGQHIDLSQYEIGAGLAGPALLDLAANGRAARPVGNRLPYDAAAPHGCYPCAGDDRWVAIAVMTDEQWVRLRGVIGEPAWAADPRFDTAGGRVAAADAIDAAVAAWTRTLDAYEVQDRCQAAGVPAGVVQTGEDLVHRDPQLAHTGFLGVSDDAPDGGAPTPVDRLPLRFSRTPADRYLAPRPLGADNAPVLRDWLGMSADEVAAAEAGGTLA